MKYALLLLAFIAAPLYAAEQYTINGFTEDRIQTILKWNEGKIDGDFLVIEKVESTIYRVNNDGSIEAQSNALVGKDIKDVPNMDLYYKNPRLGTRITPAGVFRIKRYTSPKYGRVIAFLEGPKATTAIHRVYLGNVHERRDERIRSGNASDRRITFGCVNVPEEFLDQIWDLPNGTLLFIIPETVSDAKQIRDYLTVK